MSRVYFNSKGIYLTRKTSGSGPAGEKVAEGNFGKLDCCHLVSQYIQICFYRLESLLDGIFEIESGQNDYALLYNQQTECNIRTGAMKQVYFPGEKFNFLRIRGEKLSFEVQAGRIYEGRIFLFREKILEQCCLPVLQADSLYPVPVSPSVIVLGIIKSIHSCMYPLVSKCVFGAVKARELLFVLWDEAGLLNSPKNKNEDPYGLFESIRQFIAADPGIHYSIKKLSLRFGINTTYLKTGFRKQFGKGIFQYLLELRMVQSRQLLADGTIAVSVIADKVGYGNAVSFIKAFKKYYGVTPGQIRKGF